MATEPQARLYQEGDDEGIVELLKTSFPDYLKDENPIVYWRWKYLDTPLKSTIAVVTSDNMIIGVGHRINYNVKIGRSTLKSELSDDFATHPSFRGKGVFSKIDKLLDENRAKKGVKFTYNVTTNPIIVKDGTKGGLTTFPYGFNHLIRVKDVGLHLQAKKIDNPIKAQLGILGLKMRNSVDNLVYPRNIPDAKVQILDSTKFDESTDRFWERVKEDYEFVLEKNSSYLNWRYGDPRGGRYITKLALDGEEVIGFIVLKIEEKGGYIEGYIEEILTYFDRDDVANALMRYGCNYLDELNSNVINIRLVGGHRYMKIVRKIGFVEPPEKIHLNINWKLQDSELVNNKLDTLSPDRISFNYGDYL